MPEVGGSEQQPEQIGVLGHRHGLAPQQARHLVEQVHHHVPLPGGLLSGGDAPQAADLLHLGGLLFLSPEGGQAEIEGPAQLLGGAVFGFGPQLLHRLDEEGPGSFGGVPGFEFFFGQVVRRPEAPGVFLKGLAPGRRAGGPGIGVVFQGADLGLFQLAQAGFGQSGEIFGVIHPPDQIQQRPHRRGRGAEFGGGGFVAVKRDLRHPELIPQGGPVFFEIPADHRDLAAPDPLPHQTADGPGGGSGFLLPAGGRVEPNFLRRGGNRIAAVPGDQLAHCRETGGLSVAQILPQAEGSGHLGPVFPGQGFQLGRHPLGPREKAQVPLGQGGAVVAEGHRHLGQGGQHGPHQPLFGGVEGVEFVDEHRPPFQEFGQLAPASRIFQPLGGQLQPVGGVHAGLGEEGLIPLEDEGQFGEFGFFGAAVLGQIVELAAGEPGAFQLVDGLGRHLAEGRAPPVAVVVVDVVLQFLQRPAHQHRPARVGQGFHRRAALLFQNPLRQAGEGETLHPAG